MIAFKPGTGGRRRRTPLWPRAPAGPARRREGPHRLVPNAPAHHRRKAVRAGGHDLPGDPVRVDQHGTVLGQAAGHRRLARSDASGQSHTQHDGILSALGRVARPAPSAPGRPVAVATVAWVSLAPLFAVINDGQIAVREHRLLGLRAGRAAPRSLRADLCTSTGRGTAVAGAVHGQRDAVLRGRRVRVAGDPDRQHGRGHRLTGRNAVVAVQPTAVRLMFACGMPTTWFDRPCQLVADDLVDVGGLSQTSAHDLRRGVARTRWRPTYGAAGDERRHVGPARRGRAGWTNTPP